MRVIFAGTPDFARTALQSLHRAGFAIPLVLSQPDRPAGRGMKLQASPVKLFALEHGIAVAQPRSLRLDGKYPEDAAAARGAIEAARADAMVVAAYGLILPQAVLDAPQLGCLNVHASLLPRWRGAAPIQRAILAGDEETGVTIMQMEAGLDTGPMLATAAAAVGGKSAGELTAELAGLGARLLVEVVGDLRAHPPVFQPDDGVTYANKIEKAESRLDFTRTSLDADRQIRGFNPTPGAYFEHNGERIRIHSASILYAGPDDRRIDFECSPAVVIDDQLGIGCKIGAIRPESVQRAGRGIMTVPELLRGFPIPSGTVIR